MKSAEVRDDKISSTRENMRVFVRCSGLPQGRGMGT